MAREGSMKTLLSLAAFVFAIALSSAALDIYFADERREMQKVAEALHRAMERGDSEKVKSLLTDDFRHTGMISMTKVEMARSASAPFPVGSYIEMRDTAVSNLLSSSGNSLSFYRTYVSLDKDPGPANPFMIPVTYTFVKGPHGLRIKHIQRHALLPIGGL